MAEQEQQSGAEGTQRSEEELKAQLEEEIRKVRVEDVVLQSLVSILNLAARRIAKDDERDLEQGKLGIDAAAALVDKVPEEARSQLRQAISELQLLYAKHAGGGEEPEGGDGGEEEAAKPPSEKPAEKETGTSDSGLWTPPGT